MQVEVQARGFALTEALHAHVVGRTGRALSHCESRIQKVAVRLFDTNGPRGGVDKHCMICAHLDDIPVVVVESCDEDMYAAVDSAARRAGLAVSRRLTRRRGQADGGRARLLSREMSDARAAPGMLSG